MAKYRIVVSESRAAELRLLCAKAEQEGRLPRVLKAAKSISDQIQTNPHSVGELLFHLPHRRLPVRHFVVLPLSVHFVIEDEQHVVFVTRFVLMDEI